MRAAPVIAGALLVLAVLTGCGGGDGGSRESESAEGEASVSLVAADQARARRIVLQLGDFPPGWRATPNEDDQDEDVTKCFEWDASGLVVTGRAESDDFERGSSTGATSLAAVYESAADAERAYGQIADGRFADCVVEFLSGQSDDDVTVTDVDVGRLSFPALGDESDARQIQLTVEPAGQETSLTLTAYADLITIRRDRTVAFLVFADVLSPFSPETETELAAKVARRMEP